jgi:hypothetical protein
MVYERKSVWMVTVGHVRVKGTDLAPCALGYGPYFNQEDVNARMKSLGGGEGMCHPGCTPEDETVDVTITENKVDDEVWHLMKAYIPAPGASTDVRELSAHLEEEALK